jgi:predicted Zn-dependent protease
MSALALAEEALLQGDAKGALAQVNQAIAKLAPATPAAQRAQDIRQLALEMQKEQDEENSPF